MGGDNPSLLSDISKAFRSMTPMSGKNTKLVLNGHAWNIHYTVSRMREDIVKKDGAAQGSPNSFGVALFIEIVDDEKVIADTLGRYMTPAMVHHTMSIDERQRLRGISEKMTLVSASILNCMILKMILPFSRCY